MKKSRSREEEIPMIRLRGQPSITSTFLSNPTNSIPSNNSQGDVKMKIPTNISLSDFLNRKLHRGCILSTSHKAKENLISPLISHSDMTKSNEVNKGSVKKVETDNFPLEFVLEQFKCTSNFKEVASRLSVNEELGSSDANNLHESRKRKNTRSLITIGDYPKPSHLKSKLEMNEGFKLEKKPRHLFNHYGNGEGWWDGNMEGVDNEEVGSVETWEGVGSATLGGLEWH